MREEVSRKILFPTHFLHFQNFSNRPLSVSMSVCLSVCVTVALSPSFSFSLSLSDPPVFIFQLIFFYFHSSDNFFAFLFHLGLACFYSHFVKKERIKERKKERKKEKRKKERKKVRKKEREK